MNRVFRKLNLKIAPILLLPLIITSITGIILGLGTRFGLLPQIIVNALLIIHQGRFLGEKLAPFYVLILGLGVLTIGLTILIKIRDNLIFKQAKSSAVNVYKTLALIIVFPLAICVETGVAYRLGTDWIKMTNEQTAIFLSMHTGKPLTTILGIIYTLVTGFGLILLSILGTETKRVPKTLSSQQVSFSNPVSKKSKLPLSNNVLLLKKKIRNAIIIFSLIFIGIISVAISAILPSTIIVLIAFTIPAWFIANRLIRDWQQQQVKTEFQSPETDSATILRAIPDSMLRIDESGICLGYIPAKEANSFVIKGEIINRHLNEFLDAKIALQFIKSAQLCLKSGLTHFYRFSMVAENGEKQYYEARISAIGNTEVLIMIRQLSDLDSASIDAEQPSSNPKETLLLNETELTKILELTLKNTALGDRHHILCCFVVNQPIIELNTESNLNTQNSNLSGDLLFQVAAKIKSDLSSDCIARLNDSELVALMLDCSVDRASTLIKKLRSEFNNFSFHWQGKEYPIKVSIGSLEINANSPNATDLMDMAKETCSLARKNAGVKIW